MKEKTFNELIEETPLHELLSEPEKDMVKDLLQQVREATIAECAILYVPDGNPENWLNKIHALPTDRISIEP